MVARGMTTKRLLHGVVEIMGAGGPAVAWLQWRTTPPLPAYLRTHAPRCHTYLCTPLRLPHHCLPAHAHLPPATPQPTTLRARCVLVCHTAAATHAHHLPTPLRVLLSPPPSYQPYLLSLLFYLPASASTHLLPAALLPSPYYHTACHLTASSLATYHRLSPTSLSPAALLCYWRAARLGVARHATRGCAGCGERLSARKDGIGGRTLRRRATLARAYEHGRCFTTLPQLPHLQVYL